MAIKYYPNRIFKKNVPVVDKLMARRNPITVSGLLNIGSASFATIAPAKNNWQVDRISLTFSSASNKDYSVSVLNGRKIVTDLNDAFWLHVTGTMPQSIVLTEGFYTGTTLASHIATQINANAVYNAAAITHTVAYNATTGKFTITNTSGQNVKYLDVNVMQTLRTRDSIAGHVIGFNADTDFASAITSDTACFGLNTSADIINETSSSHTSRYNDDPHVLTIDQALYVGGTGSVAMTVNYSVSYEEII